MNFCDDIKIPLTSLGVINNPHQGKFKRVLVVCQVGVLRSPTVAEILTREPFNFNCRAVGWDDAALIQISNSLVEWADVIVCLDDEAQLWVEVKFKGRLDFVDIVCLDIPDFFEFRDPRLISMATKKLKSLFL